MEYDNASDDTATKRYRLDATFAHWLAVDPDGLFEILLEVSDGDFDEAERRMALLRFQQSRERLELLPPTTEEAMAMDNKIACLQRGRELLKMITLGDLFVDIKEGELVTRLSPEGVARLF